MLAKRGVLTHDRIRDGEDPFLRCARAYLGRRQRNPSCGRRQHWVGGIDEGGNVFISPRPDLHGNDLAVCALTALAQIAYTQGDFHPWFWMTWRDDRREERRRNIATGLENSSDQLARFPTAASTLNSARFGLAEDPFGHRAQ